MTVSEDNKVFKVLYISICKLPVNRDKAALE